MKSKNYRVFTLLLAVPAFLVGCSSNPGSDPVEPTGPKVTGVNIVDPSETVVLDGTRTTLKATVTGEEGVSQKVKWSSSNSDVATVVNGVVNFLKVSKETEVTITAKAADDEQVSDSVVFTVNHSPFDLKNSRGNPDSSLFFDEGSFVVEDPQDVALVYSDVHSTRWYVEATISINSFLETDPYPKFGFMASERDDGMWCYEQSRQIFYYADTPSAGQSWSNLNVVQPDSELVNWDWGNQIGAATATPNIKKGEAFKMGFMRDGNQFYQFYGKATDVTLKTVGAFEYDGFGDQPNYVWVGGWATAVVVADAKALVGDEIDALYEVPEGLSLKEDEQALYLGTTYKIEVLANGLWDRNKLTFASSDETIATVNEKGVITASAENTGVANITVGLAGTELSATFKVTVTDDQLYNVVLDGLMNDAIWSETVKTNSYLLKKDANNFVRIYGAKNSRGLYLFMDYNVRAEASYSDGWWTTENVEFRLADDDKAWSGQYWVASEAGGRFVSVGGGTAGYSEKAEEVFYKPVVQGEDGLYHGAFEMFVPFGDDQVTKGQATYACFGFAPRDGWYNGYNWYATIGDGTLNITEDGFAHDDGVKCSESHAYGAWYTEIEPNCTETGLKARICSYCGHKDTEVLPVVADAHVFDYENAEVTTAPDCSHTGVGVAKCKLCGATEETVLPKDYSKHSDTDYPTTHAYCHDCNIGSHLTNAEGDVYDRSGVGGPWDKAGWYDIGVLEGDFTVKFEMVQQAGRGGNSSDWGSYCWRTILPMLYKEGYAGDTDGHFFRMDWCGYGGGGDLFESYNHGSDVGGLYPNGWDVFDNSNVNITITKVGKNISINWIITCNATTGNYVGKVIDYNQGAVLKDANTRIGVALTSEYTLATITKAEVTR